MMMVMIIPWIIMTVVPWVIAMIVPRIPRPVTRPPRIIPAPSVPIPPVIVPESVIWVPAVPETVENEVGHSRHGNTGQECIRIRTFIDIDCQIGRLYKGLVQRIILLSDILCRHSRKIGLGIHADRFNCLHAGAIDAICILLRILVINTTGGQNRDQWQ